MFVIPAVAAFAAAGGTIAGVGAALAGTAGFATFATVAGGFMASAGMLTKNKTLTKVGSILGLAGVATSLASSLSEGASSAWGGTGEAAGTEAGVAESAAGSDAAQFSKYAKPTEGLGTLGSEASAVGSQAGQLATGGASAGGAPLALNPPGGNLMDQYRAGLVDGSDYGTLARNGVPQSFQQTQAGALVTDGSDYGLTARGMDSASVITDGRQAEALGKLAEAGQQFRDPSHLESVLDRVRGAGKWLGEKVDAAGAWMEKNPATTKLAGDLVRGGMQMYAQNDAMNEQLNLLAQRRARLNQPVVLGIQQPQLTNYRTGG